MKAEGGQKTPAKKAGLKRKNSEPCQEDTVAVHDQDLSLRLILMLVSHPK